MMYKCLHNLAISYLQTDLKFITILQDKQLVTNYLYRNVKPTHCYKYSPIMPIVSSIRTWNRLDSLIREASSINSFKILFKRSCGM